jgi:hypothetical protein
MEKGKEDFSSALTDILKGRRVVIIIIILFPFPVG